MIFNKSLATSDGDLMVIYHDDFHHKVRRLQRKEPRLWQLIFSGLRTALDGGRKDEIPGLGGWIKIRLPAPSLGIGKRGGFRLVFLYLKIGKTVYLGQVYFKREKPDLSPFEKSQLLDAAKAIKAAFRK